MLTISLTETLMSDVTDPVTVTGLLYVALAAPAVTLLPAFATAGG